MSHAVMHLPNTVSEGQTKKLIGLIKEQIKEQSGQDVPVSASSVPANSPVLYLYDFHGDILVVKNVHEFVGLAARSVLTDAQEIRIMIIGSTDSVA